MIFKKNNGVITHTSGYKVAATLLFMSSISESICAEKTISGKPNIVFILADDLGYADLSCYGAKEIKTPNLDKMAKEAVRFTNFYAASVSTPCRASLMTGCYPKRVGLHVGVLPPETHSGLNPNEITIAEILKDRGYTTAIIGKWHLGLLPEVKPNAQGFDYYYYGMPGPNHGKSDLFRNDSLIKRNSEIEYDQITQNYTNEAISFIKNNKEKPFFLFMSHSAIHTPLFASKAFRRHEGVKGIYRDMTEELDWSCGEILKELKNTGILDNTIVIFTSDNGPYSAAAPPLHGGKGSAWEGGFRVPLIVRWSKQIKPGGVCNEMATMMDFFPTLAHITGAKIPTDRIIDGKDMLPLLTDKKGKSPYSFFCYYHRDGELAAIRKGNWKLHLIEPNQKWAGQQPIDEALLNTKPSVSLPWLYDLSKDIGETHNIAAQNEIKVKELRKLALSFDKKITNEMRSAYIEK